jgi:aryl-alcohol dehydrogenase-like predicted oxidoreductase
VSTISAAAAGTYRIGGNLPVNRLGYGTMQLTGPGVWGDPADPAEAVRVLRRAAELGVTFFDTADSYGPTVAERLLRTALHPYADDIVIATKAGLARTGPGVWRPLGRPEYLRQQAEMSLRNLGLERIPLFQLHRVDPAVPLADQVGELRLLQQEGKIGHIGLSEVSVDQIRQAQRIAPIASVQNLYNLANRAAEDVVQYAESQDIAFIPWFPLATGALAKPGGPLDTLARRLSAHPSQLALAWLLHRSPVLLPIPGTSSAAHLEQNLAAAGLDLSETDLAMLTASVSAPAAPAAPRPS